MYNKNIVRYHTVGEPVIINFKPLKPPVEEEPKEESPAEESEEEIAESEPAPEPEHGIPQEVLDKIYAEIEEIEQKAQLTEETLREAEETKFAAEDLKKQAEELKAQAEEQLKAAKTQADELLQDAQAKADEQLQAAEAQAQATIQEADKTLQDAQTESDKIIADTKQAAADLLKQTRKEGYDAGYEDGKEKGIVDGKTQIEKELAETVRQANDKAQRTIQDAKEQTAEYFIRAEDDVVRIVMMAIEKIMPQHFLDVPQVILPVVREAIHHVRDQKEIKVHVDPDSYDLILMARSEFQAMLPGGTAILEIISDDALKPGDCVIETPNGGVDARLSTRLELIRNSVRGVLNRQGAI